MHACARGDTHVHTLHCLLVVCCKSKSTADTAPESDRAYRSKFQLTRSTGTEARHTQKPEGANSRSLVGELQNNRPGG